MKKLYVSPEIEIKAFETEDIITSSGLNTNTAAVDVDGTANGKDVATEFDFNDFT